MRIVFHGRMASAFLDGFQPLVAAQLGQDVQVSAVPELMDDDNRRVYQDADIVVSTLFDTTTPAPHGLRLLHVPGAGTEGVNLDLLPKQAAVCNCFGHEHAIAEYVFSALLVRVTQITTADAELRLGKWTYAAGAPGGTRDEIAGKTIGLLGFGHIAKAIATRAKAMEMQVNVASRSPTGSNPLVDRYFSLDALSAFWASADFIVVSLPLLETTRGLVDARAFELMRPDAVLINVARGPVVDEQALFDALQHKHIAGAIIDTWYQYPDATMPVRQPSRLPFHELPNIVMTPHMSGWTRGTVRRRQQTMADNIARLAEGLPLINVVRAPQENSGGL